jgi:2-dehydropantoate 2-reductase
MPELRFLCFGAGAIGTYIGGSLAISGQKVVFVERPEVANELRQKGMHLRLPDGEHFLPDPTLVLSVTEALSNETFDAAIFAVKSFDTVPLLESLANEQAALPPFISLQNGVENEEKLAAFLGPERVIPATVLTAVGRRGVGDIAVERMRGTGLYAGHPHSSSIVEAFNQAGLACLPFASAPGMKWSKMLTNMLANASSAILNMTPSQIFSDPRMFRLEVRQLREALAVMAAQGIPVVDLPKTPVRLLAFGVKFLPLPLLQPLLKKAGGGGRGGKMPSFHIDLYSGRAKSEVEYLNGAVVRAGERLGIPTPVNRAFTETLLALTDGSISKSEFAGKPERLLKLVSS